MKSQTELDELVCSAQNGDQAALADLFEIYRDRLSKMVQCRLHASIQPRVAVSDVLQEAYVDLADQLDNYAKDPKLPFFLWLRRIAGQRLAKIHRAHMGSSKRDVAKEVRIDSNPILDASSAQLAYQLAGQFTSVSEKVIRNENESRMQTALEAMSANDREILALRHIEKMTNSEVALVLEIGESAATNRYVRAIRRLRDSLGE